MHKIVAHFVYPPIPIRTCDWQAVYDDDEPNDDGHMPAGLGRTEADAVLDLIRDNHPRGGIYCERDRQPNLNSHSEAAP